MAEMENSKDLISVLWSGADILRSKMDANEYKNYLLGIIFYKYLSDSFLIKVYDMICDSKPQTLKEALDVYVKELKSEDGEELKQGMKEECHYVIEPELTYTYFADAARNNSFNREQLQKAFNNIEQSDPIFADLFADIDLYSNRLGTGDQKQSDTVASLIKEIDKADLEFPNDLLWELDKMEFYIHETKETVKAKLRPIVIITSNAEKELPDAFLRRCIFHYITFPEPELMRQIVNAHFENLEEHLLDQAMNTFYKIRKIRDIRKKPSTSELIDWIRALMIGGIDPDAIATKLPYIGVLIKKDEDLEVVKMMDL